MTDREVTAVVCAALDDAGDAAVRRRIDALAAAGLRVRTPPRHRPHLTLGAVRVASSQLSEVLDAAAEVAARTQAVPLRLEFVGSFPRGGVLWLGPRPDPALDDLQRAVDEALRATGRPRAFAHGEPGHWIAHCTLATRLRPEALGRAVEVLAARHRPIGTAVTALATILVGGEGDVGLAPLKGP